MARKPTADERALRIAELELELAIGDTTAADVQAARFRADFTRPYDAGSTAPGGYLLPLDLLAVKRAKATAQTDDWQPPPW